ncbi:hypothetical protein Ancab_017427 [Ancistrocladus abbreviatus]
MSVRTSFASWRAMRGLIELLRLPSGNSSSTTIGNGSVLQQNLFAILPRRSGGSNPTYVGLRLISSGAGTSSTPPPPALPAPAEPPGPPKPAGFRRWAKWIMGSVVSLILSFWVPKWGALIKIGGEAEIMMQGVEKAAEVVEKVATVAEKVTADVADQLPDDNQLKEAVIIVEHVSEEAVKDAQLVEQIIHEVTIVTSSASELLI